jgi:hypothetical protein
VPFFFGQILTLLPLHIFYTIHRIEDLGELEISHIYKQINGKSKIDPKTRQLIRTLLEIRNALAHLDLVKIEYLLSKDLVEYKITL